jgi:hypothetical protein
MTAAVAIAPRQPNVSAEKPQPPKGKGTKRKLPEPEPHMPAAPAPAPAPAKGHKKSGKKKAGFDDSASREREVMHTWPMCAWIGSLLWDSSGGIGCVLPCSARRGCFMSWSSHHTQQGAMQSHAMATEWPLAGAPRKPDLSPLRPMPMPMPAGYQPIPIPIQMAHPHPSMGMGMGMDRGRMGMGSMPRPIMPSMSGAACGVGVCVCVVRWTTQRPTLAAVPHINKPKKPRARAKTTTKQAVLPQPGGQGTQGAQDQVCEAGWAGLGGTLLKSALHLW